MYTRSAECGVSELWLVSRWFAVNRRLLFLSRVAYTMFSELMRSYLGCRSSLTMVGIQFVLPQGQVGIYTADLRFVYQVNKKQEFPADRWKMKISWKPLLKCMWCAILIAQWKHWYTKLERCVLYIFPVIGRVIPARITLSVLGVFLFTLLYNTFTLLSIKFK